MNSRTDIKNNETKIDKILRFRCLRYFNVFLILLASASLSAQETNCVDGVDNDSDGKIDYLDSDCDCIIGVSNIIKFDFSNFTPIIGTGTSINNQIRYNNVGQIGNTSIDIIATVTNLNNISTLEDHGLTGTDDGFVVLPNENNSSGDVYSTTVRYQLFQSGTTSPIVGSFEIEIADIDFWSSSGSEREEAIAVRQNEITNYYLSNPTNLTTNFSNSKVTITGTQIQTDADANGAVKFLFVNQDEFTIDFSSKQTSSLTTGRAGFAVDGNEFTIFNTCLPPEDCTNGIDDDGDGLVDCEDPDCYLVSKTGGDDNDNDGIDDVCDLDDDNDGILDENEGCPNCVGGIFENGDFEEGPFPSGFTFTSQNNVPGWSTTSPDKIIEIWHSGFQGVTSQSGQYFAEINANNNAALYQRVCAQSGTVFSWSVWHRARVGTDVGVVKIGASLTTATVQTTMTSTTSAWVNYSGTYTVPPNQVSTYFLFESVSTGSGGISAGNFVDNIEIIQISSGVCADTDNDGIPNSEDLDSDGDGCFDVVESGGTDSNNDGILDGSGTSNDGTITGGTGGYDGSAEDEAIAHRMSVTSPPSNQTKNTGESTTFSVIAQADAATAYNNGTPIYGVPDNANGNINYQWYLGNPNTTGTPISNTGIYSGATTATLNISSVTDLNGSMYCVKVTHENNPCLEEIECAILSVNTTEICGDGQDNDGDGLIDCADSDCNPVIADVIPTNLACGSNNGKIIITATGSGTLTYSITNEPNYQSSNTFSNLGQGLYTIRVKNGIGCVATYNAAIIRLETPECIEVCNDGIDNDGNGLIDCDDPECTLNEVINNINNN